MGIRLRLAILPALSTAGIVTACAGTAATGGIGPRPVSGWFATWAPSQSATAARPPAGTPDRVPTYANTTIREIVHTTIGGDQVRIRISNEYGDRPLVIGAARIARQVAGSTIDETSSRALSFGGNPY